MIEKTSHLEQINKENEIREKILERGPEGEILGGIVFEEETDPETSELKRYFYLGNPYEERPDIVKLETFATREDIEAIKDEIIPMRESFEILEAMAKTYSLKQPLLLEGPTAIGKTYLVEKFTELLYGKGVKPLDFYCSGQTDVSELMAKWVPRVESEEDEKRWGEFLDSLEAKEKLSKIATEVEEKQNLSQEQKSALIRKKLRELAELAGISKDTQWSFQYGAIPKAMGLSLDQEGNFSFDEKNGMGFLIHIEEVGLAEPQVINALLKLRGKRGKVAEDIQLWENGGKKVKSGPRFWMVYSTNPPEEYLARNEIDPALARGVVFKRIGELSEESLQLAARYYLTYQFEEVSEERPESCILELDQHPEIGGQLAGIISAFHNDFSKELKKGEKGRQQQIPLTLDDIAGVADYLLAFQVRSKENNLLDLPETLRRAIEMHYLDRLADQKLKETMQNNFEEILTGVTGKVEFEGSDRTRAEILNLLVERFSNLDSELTDEEKELRRKEQEKQKADQAAFDAEDALNALERNSRIPDSVKEALG